MKLHRWIIPGFAIVHLILTAVVAIGIAPGVATLFALSPANSFFVHFYLWNVFTYPCLDRNFILAILNILILLSAGSYVQRTFLNTSYSLFVFVSLATGFSIFWIEMFFFIFTRWETFLFHEFSGLSVISAAIIVSLKLIVGKRSLLPKTLPALKFNHLPFILLCLSIICLISGGALAKEGLPMSLGMYYSWLYIRFFRKDPATDLIGNIATDFQLDALFPSSFRPALAPIFNMIFKITIILGCLKKYSSQYNNLERSNSESSLFASQDFSSSADRRKMIALQAIEDKIRGLKYERNQKNGDLEAPVDQDQKDLA